MVKPRLGVQHKRLNEIVVQTYIYKTKKQSLNYIQAYIKTTHYTEQLRVLPTWPRVVHIYPWFITQPMRSSVSRTRVSMSEK